MPTTIRVRKIEKADEPVFQCSCCGKMHAKIHHMSNGAIMGQACATLLESFCWRALAGGKGAVGHQEASDLLRLSAKQRAYVQTLGFEVRP